MGEVVVFVPSLFLVVEEPEHIRCGGRWWFFVLLELVKYLAVPNLEA